MWVIQNLDKNVADVSSENRLAGSGLTVLAIARFPKGFDDLQLHPFRASHGVCKQTRWRVRFTTNPPQGMPRALRGLSFFLHCTLMNTNSDAEILEGSIPQSQPLPGIAQVSNAAGGFVYRVDDWTRLQRFLVLGSESGTYYASARELTASCCAAVTRCLQADPIRVLQIVLEMSDSGRVPRQDPALFVLAMTFACDNGPARKLAAEILPHVCRTGTHLFHFVRFVNGLRGWGRGLKRAVGRWYLEKSPEDLAYQAVKYRQRDGWSHRDVLRQCHACGVSETQRSLLQWIARGSDGPRTRRVDKVSPRETPFDRARLFRSLPAIVRAYEAVQSARNPEGVLPLILEHRLPFEALPSEWLKSAAVWNVLADHIPLTALLRNLGRLTHLGLLSSNAPLTRRLMNRLGNEEKLRRARIHPFQVLLALKTYARGKGVLGELCWKPTREVVAALNRTFYRSFHHVVPSGKRLLVALDVSGSMHGSLLLGTHLSAAMAGLALALIFLASEPSCDVVAFQDELVPLPLKPGMTLQAALKLIHGMPFGSTDCSAPMRWAIEQRKSYDGFVVITDNETWAGPIHPSETLRNYRALSKLPARLAVIGMTATEASIADPEDAGMMDFVGFDAAAPTLLADFLRGSV